MNNKDVFAANLKNYMSLNQKSRKEVSEALGVSYYTLTDWVNGKKYPRMNKVEMLANYFGIQKSDLIEDKAKQPAEGELSPTQRELLELVANMSETEAAVLLASLKSALGK